MKKVFRWLHLALALMLMSVVFNSCTKEDNAIPDTTGIEEYEGVPLVIIDTDIGSSTDDLFAIDAAFKYERMGDMKVIGIVVDRIGEECAWLADVMKTYYGRPEVPIAQVKDGLENPRTWIDYWKMPTNAVSDEDLDFETTEEDYSVLPDGWQLYRKLLSEQPDHSVTICSLGFLPCLSQLLQSGADEYSPLSGIELVRKKVKQIYLMGGVFGRAVEPDYNFLQGIQYSLVFFNLWPDDVRMVFSPGEVGDAIEYSETDVINDIDWTNHHPIKQIYLHFDCNTGQKMWDVMAMIPIAEGDGVFSMSGPGVVHLTENGETLFTPSATGNASYQKPGDAVWAAGILEKIRTLTKMH